MKDIPTGKKIIFIGLRNTAELKSACINALSILKRGNLVGFLIKKEEEF